MILFGEAIESFLGKRTLPVFIDLSIYFLVFIDVSIYFPGVSFYRPKMSVYFLGMSIYLPGNRVRGHEQRPHDPLRRGHRELPQQTYAACIYMSIHFPVFNCVSIYFPGVSFYFYEMSVYFLGMPIYSPGIMCRGHEQRPHDPLWQGYRKLGRQTCQPEMLNPKPTPNACFPPPSDPIILAWAEVPLLVWDVTLSTFVSVVSALPLPPSLECGGRLLRHGV